MFSVVIDIVVSLCLIFLLYSLLASTIQEVIATIFQHRANTLYKGIKSMLTNTKPDKGIIVNLLEYLVVGISEKFWRLLQKLFTGKQEDTLHNRFYNHPLIKNYGQNLLFKKPSYLTAANFSTILIDVLKELEGVEKATAVTYEELCKIVNDSTVIDTETKKILMKHLNEAAGDIHIFQFRIEKWFNDSMDRVSGWYKRNTQFTLLLIGLGIAISLNVDTIQIANCLSDNKTAREQLAQMGAAAAANQHYSGLDSTMAKEVMDSIKKQLHSTTNLLALGWGTYGRTDSAYRKARLADTTSSMYKDYLKMAGKAQKAYAADSLHILTDTVPARMTKNRDSLIAHRAAIIARTQFGMLYQNEAYTTCLKVKYVTHRTNGKKLLGFLFTALAISLGSPFWFDLLNKFVSIRTSVKTVGSSGSTTSNNTSDEPEIDG